MKVVNKLNSIKKQSKSCPFHLQSFVKRVLPVPSTTRLSSLSARAVTAGSVARKARRSAPPVRSVNIVKGHVTCVRRVYQRLIVSIIYTSLRLVLPIAS